MTAVHSPLSRLYFTGRRVRLKPKGAAKLLVPISVLYGLVIRFVEFPPVAPKILVEFETRMGETLTRFYALDDLEALPVNETELREDLLGRRVHFPRSSGIGIVFPPDASDEGIIKGVRWSDGKVGLIVWVIQKGKRHDTPFVTVVDFSQCDLVPSFTENETG